MLPDSVLSSTSAVPEIEEAAPESAAGVRQCSPVSQIGVLTPAVTRSAVPRNGAVGERECSGVVQPAALFGPAPRNGAVGHGERTVVLDSAPEVGAPVFDGQSGNAQRPRQADVIAAIVPPPLTTMELAPGPITVRSVVMSMAVSARWAMWRGTRRRR